MNIKEKIIFKTYSGSKLYGTDSEKSDTDIKGIFIPDKNDLLLCKAPKHYTFSTSKNDKNSVDDIDETYYSIHYFLELVSKGETNAIDLLFAYTNYPKTIINSNEWKIIINNIDKIITKNIKSYMGYCISQCQKYSIKGEKLNNYKKFENFCSTHLHDIDKNGSTISLYTALKNSFENIQIPNKNEDKIKFNTTYFGNHCYFETSFNNESYISISDVKFALNESTRDAFHKVQKVIESYGKRSEIAAENNGADYKAISHCVRVILQVEELLTTNKIVFPLKDKEFIKSIKYNYNQMTRDEIMNWIENKIQYIENELLPKSTLREKSDINWINNFILSLYN